MVKSQLLHNLLSVMFIIIMCNAFITPTFCALNDCDSTFVTLTEEETKKSNNLIEEEKKLMSHNFSFDSMDFDVVQSQQFINRDSLLNDNYFYEIPLPPPEQNLV